MRNALTTPALELDLPGGDSNVAPKTSRNAVTMHQNILQLSLFVMSNNFQRVAFCIRTVRGAMVLTFSTPALVGELVTLQL